MTYRVVVALALLSVCVAGADGQPRPGIWPLDPTTVPPEVREALQPVRLDWQRLVAETQLRPVVVAAGMNADEPGLAVHAASPPGPGALAPINVGPLPPPRPAAVLPRALSVGSTLSARIREPVSADGSRVMAAPASPVNPRAATIGLLLQKVHSGEPVEELASWAEAHGLTKTDLLAALRGVPPSIPDAADAIPLVRVLIDHHSLGAQEAADFPPQTRLLVTAYLVQCGRVPGEQLAALVEEQCASPGGRLPVEAAIELAAVAGAPEPFRLIADALLAATEDDAAKARAYHSMAHMSVNLADYETAARYLNAFLESPEKPPVRIPQAIFDLAYSYSKLGQHEELVGRIPPLLEEYADVHDPPNAAYYPCTRLLLADSLVALGRRPEADALLSAMIAASPEAFWVPEAEKRLETSRE